MILFGIAFAFVGSIFLGVISFMLLATMIDEFKHGKYFDALTTSSHILACLFFIVLFWKLVI